MAELAGGRVDELFGGAGFGEVEFGVMNAGAIGGQRTGYAVDDGVDAAGSTPRG